LRVPIKVLLTSSYDTNTEEEEKKKFYFAEKRKITQTGSSYIHCVSKKITLLVLAITKSVVEQF